MEGKPTAGSRDGGDELQDPLALTLGSIYAAAPPPPPSPPPPTAAPRSVRRRLNSGRRAARVVKARADAAVHHEPPPFPWATGRPARHDTVEALLRRGVTTVEGHARCKRCGARKAIAYGLEAKFRALRDHIVANRHAMNDRAPDAWMYPALPDCDACGQKGAVWPEIAADKRGVNWMFLFLGQMLGCCTLEQLKYFCQNTGRHRTGAKNRVLYYAYIEMCNQLEPFDGMAPHW